MLPENVGRWVGIFTRATRLLNVADRAKAERLAVGAHRERVWLRGNVGASGDPIRLGEVRINFASHRLVRSLRCGVRMCPFLPTPEFVTTSPRAAILIALVGHQRNHFAVPLDIAP